MRSFEMQNSDSVKTNVILPSFIYTNMFQFGRFHMRAPPAVALVSLIFGRQLYNWINRQIVRFVC